MADPMKIRARMIDGAAHVTVLMIHPMETGQRKDARGQVLPAHFIQHVTATVNDRPVLNMQCGPAISRNPMFAFRVKDARPGDRVVIAWQDNKGDKARGETMVA